MTTESEYIEIGLGDDMIEHWDHGFEEIMGYIEYKLMESESYDLPLDWDVILKELKDFKYLDIEGSSQVHNFFECVSCASIDYDEWDFDSPGRSGTIIKIEIPKSELESVIETMTVVRDRLEEYWVEHGYADKVKQIEAVVTAA